MKFRSKRTGQVTFCIRLSKSLVVVMAMLFLHANISSAQNCTISTPSDPVQISIDSDCSDTLDINMLGVITNGCTGPYTVGIIYNGNNVGNIVTSDMIGETLMFIVSDPGGNNGMGEILVLDKQDPIVDCSALQDVTIDCYVDWSSVPGITEDDVTECSDFDIDHFDVVSNGDCNSDFEAIVTRTWVITDEYGNDTSCVQTIYVNRVTLNQVILPEHVYLYCGPELDTSITATGQPTINGDPITPDFPCNLLISYSDLPPIPKPDCGYKILRNWIIMDWCSTENNTLEYTQILDVTDTLNPIVLAPNDITVAAGEFDCLIDLNLAPAQITDICSDFVVTTTGPFIPILGNGGPVSGFGPGTYEITYTTIDDCGNTGSDVMTITVTDQYTPVAICDQNITVSLNDYGIAILPAIEFDEGSYDACGDVFFKVKRMDASSTCFSDSNPNNLFDDNIQFCCEDIDNSPIMVRFRAYDINPGPGPVSDDYLNGHFTECMVELNVQDKLGPEITAPDDITIDCRYPYDPSDLSVFGTVVTDPLDVNQIIIDGVYVGSDGLATDNCSISVSESSSDNIGCGGIGSIQRVFTATDPGGNIDIDVQVITIENNDYFDEDDITWPGDFTIENCTTGIDTSITGVPIINDPGCSLIGLNFDDEVFYFVPGVCFKVVRTWKVIDWCQQINGIYTTWTWQQTIKVVDNTPPNISVPELEIYVDNYNENCGPVNVSLPETSVNDCTPAEDIVLSYFIDEHSDGDYDQGGSGDDPTVSLPNGTHTVVIQADDQCGNTNSISYLVIVRDKKAPAPVVLNGVAVELMNMGNGDGMIEIFANTLNASSTDNCTPAGLLHYTFSDNYSDVSIIFNCDDVGLQTVAVYVWDTDGNYDVVLTTIDVQDNMSICATTTSSSVKITGDIVAEDNQNIIDVQVMAETSGYMIEEITNQEGQFTFESLTAGEDYLIKPIKDINHKNGVTTFDIVQIQKHIIGIQDLQSPYKMIAADINNNGSVSAIDIIELRKLILGVYDEFPDNKSWRFIDAGFSFNQNESPFSQNFPEAYNINDLTDPMNLGFIGIKVGDVNNSASVNELIIAEDRTIRNKTLMYIIEDHPEEDYAVIHIVANEENHVNGLQISLHLDPMQIQDYEIIFDESLITEEYIHDKLDQFIINVSWNSAQARSLSEENPLISIKFKKSKRYSANELLSFIDGQISPEIYIENQGTFDLELKARSISSDVAFLKVLGNRPNPFSQRTVLSFMTNKADTYRIKITDAQGKMIYQQTDQAVVGINNIQLGTSQGLQGSGVFFYTISTGSKAQSGKMIKLK